jgi:hypothetical protein
MCARRCFDGTRLLGYSIDFPHLLNIYWSRAFRRLNSCWLSVLFLLTEVLLFLLTVVLLFLSTEVLLFLLTEVLLFLLTEVLLFLLKEVLLFLLTEVLLSNVPCQIVSCVYVSELFWKYNLKYSITIDCSWPDFGFGQFILLLYVGNLCLLHTSYCPSLLYTLFMLNDFSATNTLPVLAAASCNFCYIDLTLFGFNVLSHCSSFLGAFATLRKATVSFAMSVRLSVCPHGTTRFPLEGFS